MLVKSLRLFRRIILGSIWNCLSCPFKSSSSYYSPSKDITMACTICSPGDQKFQNVILLSISFMLVFTAFQTMGNIEQTVLASISKDDPSFKGDGFMSLAIIYFSFSLCNWVAPSIVAALGPKSTMVIGSILYSAFIASFLWPNTILLYSMSAILGLGAAITWTAQGNYLTLSSCPQTISRNSGVFWAIFQCSLFFGNSFVFWQFSGSKDIDQHTRFIVFSVLTGISLVGIICLLFLRSVSPFLRSPDLNPEQSRGSRESPMEALKRSFRLFGNKKMILLSFTFFYTGIELSFFSGVYSTAVGFTSDLHWVIKDSKRLVGLCGILVGAGEVIGGTAFGLLASKTLKYGRDPVVLVGFVSHMSAFYLIFLNLPNRSPLGATAEVAFISPPWVGCLMLAAFLLGFGDACFNTQIFSILGSLFPDASAPAFALFKFTQSAAAAASFFYSSIFTLNIQLALLVVFCVIGTLTFFAVEWNEVAQLRQPVRSILVNDECDVSNPDEEQLLRDESENPEQ